MYKVKWRNNKLLKRKNSEKNKYIYIMNNFNSFYYFLYKKKTLIKN